MGQALLSSLAIYFVAASCWAQSDNRTVLGEVNEYLAAGADAIRAGRYDDGIRLTTMGLEHGPATPYERAAGLANLCAAHAAKGDPDTAISYCDQSISLNARNWRAYSNRSYAYYLKGMYPRAAVDLASAEEIAPDAEQVRQIRSMINERSLRPSIIMEEHP